MSSARHIFVATDFGPVSERALEVAIDLARPLHARISVGHVVDAPYPYPVASTELRLSAARRLDATVAAAVAQGIECRGMLLEGNAWRAIVQTAEAQAADILVVGTHGREGLSHALLGSVAEHVVRGSSVPVLTVGPRASNAEHEHSGAPTRGGPMKPVHRIVVATDFSDGSEHALDYAISLARPLDASITLLHAWEIPIYGFPDGTFIAPAEVSERLMTSAREALASTADRWKNCGVPITTELREDAPSMAVNAVAETIDADLVVTGTHGRRGLAHALLGSVAEKVVRTCTRPVLTVSGAAPARMAS